MGSNGSDGAFGPSTTAGNNQSRTLILTSQPGTVYKCEINGLAKLLYTVIQLVNHDLAKHMTSQQKLDVIQMSQLSPIKILSLLNIYRSGKYH
jgi:hypothetical protein